MALKTSMKEIEYRRLKATFGYLKYLAWSVRECKSRAIAQYDMQEIIDILLNLEL